MRQPYVCFSVASLCRRSCKWSHPNRTTVTSNKSHSYAIALNPVTWWLTISSHGTMQSEWKKWLQGNCLTGSPTEKSSLHTGHSIQQSETEDRDTYVLQDWRTRFKSQYDGKESQFYWRCKMIQVFEDSLTTMVLKVRGGVTAAGQIKYNCGICVFVPQCAPYSQEVYRIFLFFAEIIQCCVLQQ